jgi:hypothetical protein
MERKMTNELTLDDARAMTDNEILAAIKTGLERQADGLRHACIGVFVAEERGIELPILPQAFAYAAEIAEGTLSPHAAIILARFPFTIRAVMGLPLAMQDEVANGRKVKIAVSDNGRVSSREMTIFEMSQDQMRMAFSDEGITPWEQQGEWLIKSGKAKERPKAKMAVFKVNKEGDMVVSRLGVFSECDLIQILASRGYLLKRIPGWKSITA